MSESSTSTPSARTVAEYIIAKMPRRRMTFANLHLMLYYAQCWAMAWEGAPIFREPMFAMREGPRVKSIDARWYRQTMRRIRTSRRRFHALEARVFTWATRMRERRGCNIAQMNVPGGWSDFDGAAQRAWLALARVSPP